MYKKLMYAMVVSLLAVAGATTQGATLTDDFSTARDYVKAGTAGTMWDGFTGLGPGETVDALTTAEPAHPGQLYIASTNAWWQPPATNLVPPLLYKMVSGDFIATVKVTDFAGTSAAWVGNNNASLMARAPLGAVGTGENWESCDYFPEWNCGNFVREEINGTRSERGNNGKGFNLDPWLQLERNGNVFHFRSSVDGVTWTELAASPRTRNDLAGVALEVGLSECTYTTDRGYAAFDNFTISGPGIVPLTMAYNPKPANLGTDVLRDTVLSWTPNAKAVKSDVYFGTSLADVNAASKANPLGVLVGQGQDANTYDPPGVLAYGQTYYWRVDGTDANGTFMGNGDIWSFTVEALGYVMTNITATASSNDAGKGPEMTINGSGMTGDLAGTDPKTMWNTTSTGPKPAWIQYSFDKVYKMQEMWVWNYNSEVESIIGFGLKNVTIQYSTNGTDWTTLGDFVLNQAPGADGYDHNTTVPLAGIAAKQIKILVKSNWNAAAVKSGLSEVRFFYTPVWAREPKPATASTNIDPGVTLSWRPGRGAVTHNVNLGTDPNALTLAGTATTNSYAPANLSLGTTYYWRIDEVNAAETPSSWAGDVWSFSTPDFVVVDDMESYNDSSNQIFNVWVDGYGTTTNGSVVGYNTSANSTFGETTIIHGGRQSMPLAYNNTGTFTGSEATRTFTDAQDWTRAGIKTLVIFFRGGPANTTGQLYAKINGTKVNYTGDAAILSASLWKEWNIDLASAGVNLKAVKTLAIGISGSGKGILYFDDIRLYKTAPAVVQPTNPGTTNLMAYFTMESEVKDTTGHGYTGTLYGVTFVDSMLGFGKAAQFNGTTSYVDLSSTFSSGLIQNLTNCTFAVWVNFTNTGGQWQRVFDFGNAGIGTANPTVYMFLTTRNGGSAPRFVIKTATTTEATANGSAVSTGWHHVTAAIDASGVTPLMGLYVDGALAQGGRTARLPKDMGATTQNWLGRSQYTADPYFNGSIDDFRIYNRVLTAGEISYLAGDR